MIQVNNWLSGPKDSPLVKAVLEMENTKKWVFPICALLSLSLVGIFLFIILTCGKK